MLFLLFSLFYNFLIQQAQSTENWDFEWQDDFREDAILDLRYLNEKIAGERGFIRLSQDKNSFLYGDGKPIRFWTINTFGKGDLVKRSMEDWQKQARFLAKMGFNLVRTQFSFHDRRPTYGKEDDPRVEEKYIEGCHKMVAAMKEQGIYSTISPFWAHGESTIPAEWNFPELTGQKVPLAGLIYFHEGIQNVYKKFCKKLYLSKNPYTGIPLSKDPSVAMILTMNEDSLLFWTTQRMPMPAKKILAKNFTQWVKKKYGSIQNALKAWENAEVKGSNSEPGDNLSKSELGFYSIWELTQNSQGGIAKRKSDQLQFFSETQYNFFKMIKNFYENELKMKIPIVPENWRTANDTTWLDMERWSYTAQDVMAKTKYFNAAHEGQDNGWLIIAGHYYNDVSALHRPWQLPTNFKQVLGFPFINHETSWVNPNIYQSEGPFLVAAYQSLNGVDGVTWFNANDTGFDIDAIITMPWRGNQKTFDKWTCLTPSLAATFPAAAIAYRRNDIKEGKPVVIESRPISSLWNAEEPLISEDQAYDPNRDKGIMQTEIQKSRINPLAFLVGPVMVKYTRVKEKSLIEDMSKFINEDKGEVKSITDEILLNYKIGFCTVNTPKTQGACGFLSKVSPIKLNNVEINVKNDYLTIIVTSLDDLPISDSKKILVQVTTKARPTGWTSTPANLPKSGENGFLINDVGNMPWKIESPEVLIKISNKNIEKAFSLTSSGYKDKDINLTNVDGSVEFKYPENNFYAVLTSK